ncbi:hypothetical protein FHN90_25475 [Shigella sonnei]|nr:hypothetical protein [Escherichia coli]EFW7478969.1 hypothetical protein [Shigella sonnei]
MSEDELLILQHVSLESFFLIFTVFIFVGSVLFSIVLFMSVFACVFLYFSIYDRCQVFTDTQF